MENQKHDYIKYVENGYMTRFTQNPTVRRVLPVWIFIVIMLITMAILNPRLILPKNLSTMLMLASFMAIAGLGQGFVILTGGIDLSIPWVAAYSGIITTWFSQGNYDLLWLIPTVLLLGGFVGLINGVGVVALKINCVVMTMGMNAILEGIAMLMTGGTPEGDAPPALVWFSSGEIGGLHISVIFIAIVTIFVSLILTRTAYGRKIYAIGNNRTAAAFSGIQVNRYEISVYAISGICSALLGLMLAGFIGESYLGMGNQYLLTSIAAVAIGGAAILGGKGHYLGTLGGAILLSMVSMLLSSFILPAGIQNIIFGVIILIAVIGVREKGQGL
jgi:ribose transport system permease protein